MKKILSLVLVAAMMLSLVVFAPAASAANIYTVEVTDATASAGSTVTLDVVVTGSTIFGFGLAIEYDATRLANPVMTPNMQLFGAGTAYNEADYQAGFTTNANNVVDGVDASEGVVVLTVEFEVLDDAPAGDAYVRVAPFKNDSKIYICETDVKATGARFDWDVIEGTVTVMPEGLAAGAVTPADDMWDFEEGIIYGCLDENLAGDIAIPSQINGEDVIEISAAAFDGFDAITSILVPATVEYIAAGAFYNLTACTDMYILNPDCEIEDAAMGYEGSWRSGKLRNAAIILTEDETVLLTVHGIAGSTAQAYAEAGDGVDVFGWGEYAPAKNVTIVTPNGTAAYVASGDSVALPASYAAAGKTIVGWNVNGSVVAPGATVAIDGDTAIEAVTVGFATENGASIKVVDTAADTALRFTAALNKADYANLEAIYGAENVSHGMLIVPQQYIKRAGGFTHAALEDAGLQKLDYEMTGCYVETADEYILAASIKGFSASTLAKNPKFAAVGYIAINVGGETTYVYGDYTQSTARDAKFVLTETLKTATGDAKTWMTTLLGTFA